MHYSSLGTTAAIIFSCAQGVVIPPYSDFFKRFTAALEKRDVIDSATFPGDKYEVEVGYGGGEFNWGSTPIWAAIDTMGAHCEGLSCTKEQWPIDTIVVLDENTDTPRKGFGVNMAADGIYEEPMRNGMIELLKHAASMNYHTSNTMYWDPPCDQPGSNECTWGAKGPVDQYHGPKRITVRVHEKANGKDNDMSIEAVDDSPKFGDVCSTMVGMATAFGGAFHGALAAGISTLSLLCM